MPLPKRIEIIETAPSQVKNWDMFEVKKTINALIDLVEEQERKKEICGIEELDGFQGAIKICQNLKPCPIHEEKKCGTKDGMMYCFCGKCKPEDYPLPKDYDTLRDKPSSQPSEQEWEIKNFEQLHGKQATEHLLKLLTTAQKEERERIRQVILRYSARIKKEVLSEILSDITH